MTKKELSTMVARIVMFFAMSITILMLLGWYFSLSTEHKRRFWKVLIVVGVISLIWTYILEHWLTRVYW